MKKVTNFIKKHKIDIIVMALLIGFIVVSVLIKTAYGVCFQKPAQTMIPSKSLIPYVREIKEPVVMHSLDEAEPIIEEVVCEELIIEEIIEEPVIEEPKTLYFDVPLDRELQDHIFALCDERGIDPAIVIAMIEKESTYRASAVGDSGNSLGLMQIQPRWHKARMERLGCTDLLDPYQNVTVGIDILAGLIDCNEGMEWALMAYNGGSSYAYKKVKAGVVSDYAKTVLANAQNYVRVE